MKLKELLNEIRGKHIIRKPELDSEITDVKAGGVIPVRDDKSLFKKSKVGSETPKGENQYRVIILRKKNKRAAHSSGWVSKQEAEKLAVRHKRAVKWIDTEHPEDWEVKIEKAKKNEDNKLINRDSR